MYFRLSVASWIGFGKWVFPENHLCYLLSFGLPVPNLPFPSWCWNSADPCQLQVLTIFSPKEVISPWVLINSVLPQFPLFVFSATRHLLNQSMMLISLYWNIRCGFCSLNRTPNSTSARSNLLKGFKLERDMIWAFFQFFWLHSGERISGGGGGKSGSQHTS